MTTLSRKSATGSTKSSGRSISSSRSAEKLDERRSLDENRSQMEGDGLLKDALHPDAAQHVKAAQTIEHAIGMNSNRGSAFEDKMQSVLDEAANVRSFGESRTSGFAESKSVGLGARDSAKERLDAGAEVQSSKGATGVWVNQAESSRTGTSVETSRSQGVSNNSASRESGVSVGYSHGSGEMGSASKSQSAQAGLGEAASDSVSASQERPEKAGKDGEARTSSSTSEGAARSDATNTGTAEASSYGHSVSRSSGALGVETSLSVAERSQRSNVERVAVGQALDELDPRSGEALLNGQKVSNSSHETISRSFEDGNGASVREGLSSERSVTYDLDESAGDVAKTLKQSFCETTTQTLDQSLDSESAMEGVGSGTNVSRSHESAGVQEQALESTQQREQTRGSQESEAAAEAEAEEEMDMSD